MILCSTSHELSCLLWFGTSRFYPYSSGLLYWYLSNTVAVVQTWRTSCWRHKMEKLSALLALCAGNSPVTGEFPAQRPVTRCFHVFFDLRLNKRFSKQSWGWWFETPSRPSRHHCNDGYEYLRACDITIKKLSTAKQCAHRLWYILLAYIRPRLLANNVVNILKWITGIQSNCPSSIYRLAQPIFFQDIW